MNAADFRPVGLHDGNAIVKFADDTYLIIPADRHHTAETELENAKSWAEANNLHLNQSKTVEIIYYIPDKKKWRKDIPAACPGQVRADTITALGVELTNNF